MVKLMGHLGMALLWSLPAWFVWDRRLTLVFVGFVLTTAMLPDVDLVLADFLPVVHHGVTHTVLFVTVVALAAGAIAEYLLRPWLEAAWLRSRGRRATDGTLFAFVAGGLLLGGYSHLFTDMLSSPDIAAPIEPFWPVLDKPWSFDVIWYSSFRWNVGLLAVGVALHVLLAVLDVRITDRYGITVDS